MAASSSYDAHRVPDERSVHAKKEEWIALQQQLSSEVVIPADEAEWDQAAWLERHRGSYLVGTDLSFFAGDGGKAVASLVVAPFDDIEKVAWEKHEVVDLPEPYIPNFLSFRELTGLLHVWRLFEAEQPDMARRVSAVLLDGNGILHPRRFGVAAHFGVTIGRPTVGSAKTLLHLPGFAGEKAVRDYFAANDCPCDYNYLLKTADGQLVGAAIRSHQDTARPIFVSPGHLLSVAEALAFVRHAIVYRVPEPIRKADLHGRRVVAQLEAAARGAPAKPTKQRAKSSKAAARGRGQARGRGRGRGRGRADLPPMPIADDFDE